MIISSEILLRIQEGRKFNPNSPKKIIYFVGPTACGKTTKVKNLEKIFGNSCQYITLDGFTSILGNQSNTFLRNLVNLFTLSEKLFNGIETAAKTHQNTIFVDSHPFLSVFQCEAIYKLHNGRNITENQFNLIRDVYKEIVDYINSNNNFKDFQQIIYYINIPLKENLTLLQNKENCREISEDMKNELVIFRSIIHSSIFNVNQFKDTKIIEVNTISGLEIIHMYLLGRSGCC
ncbi:MAG: hypothetical protein ACFE91_15705 [Promethearchaeota archaeon]